MIWSIQYEFKRKHFNCMPWSWFNNNEKKSMRQRWTSLWLHMGTQRMPNINLLLNLTKRTKFICTHSNLLALHLGQNWSQVGHDSTAGPLQRVTNTICYDFIFNFFVVGSHRGLICTWRRIIIGYNRSWTNLHRLHYDRFNGLIIWSIVTNSFLSDYYHFL